MALGDLFGTNAQAAVDAATGGNLIAENGAMTPDGKYGTVLQMFEDGQAVRREGVRRFQVPGCEFELNPTACTVRSCEKGGTQQRRFIQDATGKPVMSADVVVRLVRGYGGDISPKYALFDSEEGNVASPSGMDSIDLFALDEPIHKKKIKRSDGYNTVVYGSITSKWRKTRAPVPRPSSPSPPRKATRRSGSGARSTPSRCTWLSARGSPRG